MKKKKAKKIGLVLGRFQPPHTGHLFLIKKAFQENDEVIICIGSAQISNPLSIKERHNRIKMQMRLMRRKNYRIVDLADPKPMRIWPSYVMKKCKITKKTINTFYRGKGDLPKHYKKSLEKLGFVIETIPRKSFIYKLKNHSYRINSATEIIRIHKKLGLEKLI